MGVGIGVGTVDVMVDVMLVYSSVRSPVYLISHTFVNPQHTFVNPPTHRLYFKPHNMGWVNPPWWALVGIPSMAPTLSTA